MTLASDTVKSISLRTLVREPLKVKRMTRAGQTVQVTDNGEPLWILHPAVRREDTVRRTADIEAELAEVLTAPGSALPLSRMVLESRR